MWFEIEQKGKNLKKIKDFTLTESNNQLYVFGGLVTSPTTYTRGNITVKSLGHHGLWAFTLGNNISSILWVINYSRRR